MSVDGKKYGTEYETLHTDGNIKFVRYKGGSAKTPMETMTKGRIYGTVSEKGTLKSLTFYDSENKRNKQIDLEGIPHKVKGVPTLPHTHKGYWHDELGTRGLSAKETKLVVKAVNSWYNRPKK
ncbi:TPA: hypothetical protein ACQOKB_000081 [Streptococcus pyogenes]|uniref:hypothetical protein n=1 Tax=Streptococcus canis TaxID=1329 RepID=UPI0020B74D9A|nr:hypothetical protein [Streptococcus canis]